MTPFIVFTYIWQGFAALFAAAVLGLSIWAFVLGNPFHGWLFIIYTATAVLWFLTGHFWRKTARLNIQADAELEAELAKFRTTFRMDK